MFTPPFHNESAADREGIGGLMPPQRSMMSDETAETAAFLLGEEAGFITGTDLRMAAAAIRMEIYRLYVMEQGILAL